VKLLAPATGAVGFFASGVATAGVLPSVEGAGVVWAAAERAETATKAAVRMMFFIGVSSFHRT
jgi:hypothetical protein